MQRVIIWRKTCLSICIFFFGVSMWDLNVKEDKARFYWKRKRMVRKKIS